MATMNSVFSHFSTVFLTPLKHLKKKYLPLLAVYFAFGAQQLTVVAITFWQKEFLGLSALELSAISVWVSLPFAMKILFGPLVDGMALFGSKRKVYIFLGALLISAQFLLLYGLATEIPWIIELASIKTIYLTALILGTVGFVIQDITADTLSTEVVDRTEKSAEEIQKELGMVQVLGRLFLYFGSMATAGLGGYLASQYSFETVMLIALGIPMISVLGALFVRIRCTVEGVSPRFSRGFWLGILAYAASVLYFLFAEIPFAQEITFVVSLTILLFIISTLVKKMPNFPIKTIFLAFLMIFVYRAVPGVGPGFSWFAIENLGFDQAFFGVLAQTSAIIGVGALWLMADWIARCSIRRVFFVLIIVSTLLSLPDIMLYYGIHETLGLSAKTIALIDTAAGSPLINLAMVPMLTLIAITVPATGKATWFAVIASTMNLALTAQHLGTKYLNTIFPISNAEYDATGTMISAGNYEALGPLLWWSVGIGLAMSLIVWCFCPKKISPTVNQ